MPPLVIAPGKGVSEGWLPQENRWADLMLAATDSGWIDTAVFNRWFDRFIDHVHLKRQLLGVAREEPALLVLDGHSSHISLAMFERAEENSLVVYVLPAHTSHVSQPLDVACFSTWHCQFGLALSKRRTERPAEPISRSLYIELMEAPWAAALSPGNIASGFKATGIFPFDHATICNLGRTSKPSPSSLSPAHAVDRRPSESTRTAPSATPTTPSASPAAATTPLPTRRSPKSQLVADLTSARRREQELLQRQQELLAALERERRLRLDQVLRLPLSPVNADVSGRDESPRKRARTVPGFGVLTAAEIRAQLNAKAAEKANADAAKSRAREARAAASAAGRPRGRPPKGAAPAAPVATETAPTPTPPLPR
jgi:hypothetical protein